MRYLLIILSLVSFSLCQFLPSDNVLANISYEEKIMIYYGEKKSPVGSLLREIFIPTLGYAYIEDWNRGLYIVASQIGLALLANDYNTDSHISIEEYANLSFSNCGNNIYGNDCYKKHDDYKDDRRLKRNISTLILYSIHLYKSIDLFNKTNNYNEQLHNKIFSKKDKKLSYLILPTSNGAYLNLSYKF